MSNNIMPNTRHSMPKKSYSKSAALSGGRLSEADVRKIFTCMKEGRIPPKDIAFNIIKSTDRKPMLSPPSFEFGDGIYVLLRSTTDSNNVAVPSGLEHLVLSDDDLASMEVCKWSLSGPGSKTKKNGALQQRYSYPRGRPEYSDFKGGSMWTMIDNTGNDSLEVRVFHVYRSLKRLSSGTCSGEISGGGSSDWSSSNSATNMNAIVPRKSQPLKKRIKMEEDERVDKVYHMKQHPKKTVRLEEDAFDTLLRDQVVQDDLDTSLNVSEYNIFGEDVDNGYSFIPVPNASSILDGSDMAASAVSASSLYQEPTTYSPFIYDGMNGAAPSPLPYSYDTSSQNNSNVIGRPLGLLAFSNKLYQLQDCIFNDIMQTQSVQEQNQKLAVLQHWAKVTAQRPLQPCVFAPVDNVPSSSSSDANVPTSGIGQFPIEEVSSKEDQTKIGDTGLPRITP